MHFDVLIVGAGLSGIGAGYHLQEKCPGKSYAILEGRDCIGGTWDLFRYPGIRSDSDMFTLGYSFKPWTEPKAIADGPSILNYVRETAVDNGIDKKIRFNHRVKRASWSSPDARWTVEAARTVGEGATEAVSFTCNFLFMCSGYYKYEEGYTPEFAGTADFAGQIVHPQKWPEDLDYAGKRVVVIGSGATAVTLVPEMAKNAAHVTMLQRSPTYVVARPAEDALANKLRQKSVGQTRLSHDPLAQRAVRHVFLPALPTQARPRQAIDPRRRQDGAGAGLRRRQAFHAALQSMGAAAVPGARRRPVQGDPRQARLRRHQRDRHLHEGWHQAEGRQRTRRRHHRHRDRAEPAGARRARSQRRRPHGRFREDAELQGHDVFGRAEHGLGVRLHQRVLDAEMRSDLRICLPPDQLHGPAAATSSACRIISIPSLTELPSLDFSSGYVQRSIAKMPKQGSKRPWRLYQNYALDIVTLRYGKVDDGVMQYS